MFDSPNNLRPDRVVALRQYRFAAAALVMMLAGPASAHALVRSCGADPVANTANVLCAAPSGPCNATSVLMSVEIQVLDGSCHFDLGGRALTWDANFQITGGDSIVVDNASAISITTSGKLKARGDFNAPQGTILSGGAISLLSSGTIYHYGVIDVYGDDAGSVRFDAGGNVWLGSTSAIRGVGESAGGTDERYANGGDLEVTSASGGIDVAGEITMRGQVHGEGGEVVLRAARHISVTQPITATGGEGGGGSIILVAGDDILVTRALDAESGVGGGSGGEIVLVAGDDSLGGVVAGGDLIMETSAIRLSGSGGADCEEGGGTFKASASGDIDIASDCSLQVGAVSTSAGDGGSVELSAGGNLSLAAPVNATSGGAGGGGGRFSAFAGGDVQLAATADLTLDGKEKGGVVNVSAGDAYVQASDIDVRGTGSGAEGGEAYVTGCSVSVEGTAGIEANASSGATIELTARGPMTIGTSTDFDAVSTGGAVRLTTRTFGTCNNDPTRHCRSNVECTIGCSTGTCLNINPNTGGSTAQFSPAALFAEKPSLAPCN
jgi:hypothetical protein